MCESIIELVQLTKRYGHFTAVDRLDLKIHKGEIFGLLGPNGAGKSTTILMMLGLADVLIKNPEVIILDEPTSGIDPAGVQEFISLIRQLRDERGLTVLFSSHHLDQVQQICDRVGLFSQGRLLADLSLNDLQQEEHGLEYIYNQYFGGGQGHE